MSCRKLGSRVSADFEIGERLSFDEIAGNEKPRCLLDYSNYNQSEISFCMLKRELMYPFGHVRNYKEEFRWELQRERGSAAFQHWTNCYSLKMLFCRIQTFSCISHVVQKITISGDSTDLEIVD